MPRSHTANDRALLTELIQDFSVSSPPDVESALKLLQLRFQKLNAEQFSLALSKLSAAQFEERFGELPWKMHHYLFKDIISCAGIYRRESDPKRGVIYFGLGQKFRGAPPQKIHRKVLAACSFLNKETDSPISDIVRFYQLFVCVHPFYDANGRIGRFIADIYLDFHGYHMSWGSMRKNQKWLKKLNACHRRMGQNTFENYMDILIRHWEKYIIRKDDIEPND